MSEHHHMAVTARAGHDARFECPTCGRTVVVTWQPTFTWTVVARGDDEALHDGAVGEVTLRARLASPP